MAIQRKQKQRILNWWKEALTKKPQPYKKPVLRKGTPHLSKGERMRQQLHEHKKWIPYVSFKDRKHGWDVFGVSLSQVERELCNYKIHRRIKRDIGNYSEKKPFKVCELGCGPGIILAGIKKEFRERCRTVGLVFEKTPGEEYRGVDNLIVGDVHEVNPGEAFDLIYSQYGAMLHTRLKETAVQRVVDWLKPGGTAVLDLGDFYRKEPWVVGEVKQALVRKGIRDAKFKLNHIGNLVLIFDKPLGK